MLTEFIIKPIIINGGDQTRDFIYVDDVVRVIYESVKMNKRKTYEVVNVLTGKTTSMINSRNNFKKLNFDPKEYKPFPKESLKSIGSTKNGKPFGYRYQKNE